MLATHKCGRDMVVDRVLFWLVGLGAYGRVKVKYIFLAAIFSIICLSLFLTTHTPLLYDSVTCYVPLAQMIVKQHAIYTPEQVDFAGTHPLLVPLLYALAGRMVMPVIFMALITYFYWLSRSAIFTFFLAAMPLFVIHSSQLYADLPLAALYLAGSATLLQYMSDRKSWQIVVAAVAFGLAIHTKSLGLPLMLISGAVFTVWYALNRRNWWHWLAFVAILLAFYAPLHFTHSTIAQHARNISAQASGAPQGQVYVAIYRVYAERSIPAFLFGGHGFLARLFNYADFGLLYFALIILTVTSWRRVWGSDLKYLLAIIVAGLGAIGWALYQPQLYQYCMDGTLCTRMLLAIAPTALYYVFMVYDAKPKKNSLLNAPGEVFSDQPILRQGGN